jgi:hypothetical protein
MAEVKNLYGTTTAMTATGLATLADNGSVTSAAVDNTTDLFLDALVELVVATGAAATATGYIEIYAKGSVDNTDYDDDNNDKWLGTLSLVTAGAATRKRIVSVASGFGGAMPPYWQIRIRNLSGGGAALTSGTLSYRGVKVQSV